MNAETLSARIAETRAAILAFAACVVAVNAQYGAELHFEVLRLRLAAAEVLHIHVPFAPTTWPGATYIEARTRSLGVEGLAVEHGRLSRVLAAVQTASQVLDILFHDVSRTELFAGKALETLDYNGHLDDEERVRQVARAILDEAKAAEVGDDVRVVTEATAAGRQATQHLELLFGLLLGAPEVGSVPEPTDADPTKPTMGLWRKRGIRGGKFLVQRRDGSVPDWPWFVLGGKDAAAEHALRAYADKADELHYDGDYVADVRELADEFLNLRTEQGPSDPDAKPHRRDDPAVVARLPVRGSA